MTQVRDEGGARASMRMKAEISGGLWSAVLEKL